MKKSVFLVVIAALAGCQYNPGFFYEASTGRRVDSDPQSLARFEPHKTECNGEAAKAALTSTAPTQAEHRALVDMVYQGCMRTRGYVVRPQ